MSSGHPQGKWLFLGRTMLDISDQKIIDVLNERKYDVLFLGVDLEREKQIRRLMVNTINSNTYPHSISGLKKPPDIVNNVKRELRDCSGTIYVLCGSTIKPFWANNPLSKEWELHPGLDIKFL